jgi:hypothetical protein
MARENLIYNSFRLNMNNPQHVKINNVLKNLNPKIFKSRNQFIADAVEFYSEHYGDESFIEHNKEHEIQFVTLEEIEEIKTELIEIDMTEARKEVIRLLGGVISGMQVLNPATNSNVAISVPDQQDDEVVSEWALKCMNNEEGEN